MKGFLLLILILLCRSKEIHGKDTNNTNNNETTSTNKNNETTITLRTKLDCYDNTTVLGDHLKLKNTTEPETYVLCPNTVFPIGSTSDPNEPCCNDGMNPLNVKANTIISCGEDGNPDNNCIFIGGQFQLISFYTSFEELTENAEIHGVTFIGASYAGALFANGGNIKLLNCVFKDHRGIAPIISSNSKPRSLIENRMRDMDDMVQLNYNMLEYMSIMEGEGSFLDRHLLGDDNDLTQQEQEQDPQPDIQWSRQETTFDSCLFINNKKGDAGGEEKLGVITVEQPNDDVIITNCIFQENSYGGLFDRRGYAISVVEGSTLTLTNNCFIGNDFFGKGTVIVHDEETISKLDNNFGDDKKLGSCEFVAIVINGSDKECKNFDAIACGDRKDDENETLDAAAM